ncbi:Nuclear elongation and deformation protein 1 [Coelomomyces lativittatus]|nr:Nuclear elongation and deformation protein 1 [Coelomomyces lativittatus]
MPLSSSVSPLSPTVLSKNSNAYLPPCPPFSPPSPTISFPSSTASRSIENQINKSTFSGAIDIIVVQHSDGQRSATPFHVRFGRFKLLRPDNRSIVLFIGQHRLNVTMCMDLVGVGRFPCGEITLTSSDLQEFPLNFGANRLTYVSFDTKKQPVSLDATIYLWDVQTKCVISDIDGTITKSDALGVIIPTLFGHSYAHPGVTRLYQKIHQEGYQFIYLTARGIGHSLSTKKYLKELVQSKYTLPEGPLLTAPDSLLKCIQRTWTSTTALFKAQALLTVANVFNRRGHEIFIGGFGNRSSDLDAYTLSGIPLTHQFRVSTCGKVENPCFPQLHNERSISKRTEKFSSLIRNGSKIPFLSESSIRKNTPSSFVLSYESLTLLLFHSQFLD